MWMYLPLNPAKAKYNPSIIQVLEMGVILLRGEGNITTSLEPLDTNEVLKSTFHLPIM